MTVAIIPLRKNSKRIKNKNIKKLCGKRLFEYVVEAAEKACLVDYIIISTDIKSIRGKKKWKKTTILKRKKELCDEKATLDHVIVDIEKGLNPKINKIITIQATSPFLKTETINKSIAQLNEYKTVLTVQNIEKLCYKVYIDNNMKMKHEKLYKNRINSQNLKTNIYNETGAIIGCQRDVLKKGSRISDDIFFIETEKKESIDIDTKEDWKKAKKLFRV